MTPFAIAGVVLIALGGATLGGVRQTEALHDQAVDAERARAGLPPRALAPEVGPLTGATLIGAGLLAGTGSLLVFIAAVMR